MCVGGCCLQAIFRENLAIENETQGADHSDTRSATNNLASSLADQGKYSEAEAIYRGILATEQRLLPDEHQDLIGTTNNLASTYSPTHSPTTLSHHTRS